MTGYTPVPSVAAGDWIDEIFINTYWVDNMAAGLPDLFSAKGQMAVGLGVDDMGILDVGADEAVLHADSSQALGVAWREIVLISQRQGNSATNWNTQGTINYTPANARILVGAGQISFSGTNSASMLVTYPTAFAYSPIILLTARAAVVGGQKVDNLYTGNEIASRFYAFANLGGIATGTLDFFWMAIGPRS